MHEGELNGETVNDQSVTKTKYGCLEITWPAVDHDLIDALGGRELCKQCRQNEKRFEVQC